MRDGVTVLLQPDGVKRMTMVSAEGGRYTGETNMEGKRQVLG